MSRGDELKQRLLELFNLTYKQGKVPSDWTKSTICPIYKNKGDPSDCKNYRGISLMSHVGKIYERILERRVRNIVEPMLLEQQCGFRPERGTTDQISSVRLLLEKSWEYNLEQHICFIDLEKAFDRIPRKKMWEVLKEYGINGSLLKAIQSTYEDQASVIRGGTSYFKTNTGVRQGSVLSPILFIIYMDRVMRETMQGTKDCYQCFAYADDIAQTATTKEGLIFIMNKWIDAFDRYDLKMSTSKTEYMPVSRSEHNSDLQTKNGNIKATNSFTYLGCKLTSVNSLEEEIDTRIIKYSKNVGFLYPLLKERNIPVHVKVHIYTSILRPILLYGSETWTLTTKLKSKLQAAEMRVLRLIHGVTKLDHIRNDTIRSELQIEPLLTYIEKSQLRWYGHIKRRGPENLTKKLLDWKPPGKRNKGRPRKRWLDNIKEILDRESINIYTANIMCQNRGIWRKFVQNLSTYRPSDA
jgi:hypothetical protein